MSSVMVWHCNDSGLNCPIVFLYNSGDFNTRLDLPAVSCQAQNERNEWNFISHASSSSSSCIKVWHLVQHHHHGHGMTVSMHDKEIGHD
jgi:hypothetical protein